MTSERPSAEEHIQYADREQSTESRKKCAICGSTDSLSRYSVDHAREMDNGTPIDLCPTHYQVATLLNGPRARERDHSSDRDLRETRKITVRVPRALIETADSTAERHGQTRSELVRDAIQMTTQLEEMSEAFDDILSQAVQPSTEAEPQTEQSEPTTEPAADPEFLKERIRTLESLLEESIEKI